MSAKKGRGGDLYQLDSSTGNGQPARFVSGLDLIKRRCEHEHGSSQSNDSVIESDDECPLCE